MEQGETTNLAIDVTRSEQYIPHLKALEAAARKLGATAEVVHLTDNPDLNQFDGIINRSPIPIQGVNTPLLNQAEGIVTANDKYLSYKALVAEDLPCTPSILVTNQNELADALKQIKSISPDKFVMKYRFGAGGKDITIHNYEDKLKIKPDDKGDFPIIQPYRKVQEDYKLIVIGGEVEQIIYRSVPKNLPSTPIEEYEFRSNATSGGVQQIHLPGNPETYKTAFNGQNSIQIKGQTIPKLEDGQIQDMARYAIKASKILDLNLASVDFTFDKDGNPEILEIDPTPWLPNNVKAHPEIIEELDTNDKLYQRIIQVILTIIFNYY